MLGVGFSVLGLLLCMEEGWLMSLVFGSLSLIVLLMINDGGLFAGKMSMNFGGDTLSFVLIVLSFWLIFLMVMASESEKGGSKDVIFIGLVIFMGLFLFMSFIQINLLMFYIFFESSLIPIFMLVIGYGYQPERLMAGLYMFMYTLFASLPLLFGLMSLAGEFGSLSYCVLGLSGLELKSWWWIVMMVAFLVKLPMFFVHLWLPKAHVEAPVSGSMILAGVLLKLGGYGIFRVVVVIKNYLVLWGGYLIGIGLGGAVIVGFLCLTQTDVSSLIAYSSVGHMGMVLAGILTMSYWGFQGGMMMMVAHGLCSSGLFCLANILYERFYSRSLILLKGILSMFPGLGLWWFLMSITNMAAPPSLNLFSEILIMISVVKYMWWVVWVMMLVMFLAGAYSLWMYSSINHGEGGEMCFKEGSIFEREYYLIFCHWFPLNVLMIHMDMVSLVVF